MDLVQGVDYMDLKAKKILEEYSKKFGPIDENYDVYEHIGAKRPGQQLD